MDDLIAGLNGGMHVSQESYDLESFKASLARTLVVPASPSEASSSRTRPPSLSLPSGFTFTALEPQTFPSPTATYDAYPFIHEENRSSPAPPYEQHDFEFQPYQSYQYDLAIEDDGLEAAFAGDAFAPLQAKAKEDPWRLFREKQGAFGFQQPQSQALQQQQPAFQFAQQQQNTNPAPQYAPQYAQQSDEDAAEAMITDE